MYYIYILYKYYIYILYIFYIYIYIYIYTNLSKHITRIQILITLYYEQFDSVVIFYNFYSKIKYKIYWSIIVTVSISNITSNAYTS